MCEHATKDAAQKMKTFFQGRALEKVRWPIAQGQIRWYVTSKLPDVHN